MPGPYFPHGMLNENAGDVGLVGGAGGALFSDRPRGPGVIPSASLEVDREAREVTRRYVEAVRPHVVKVLDTRKTTPGWRALEKRAVRAGGGTNPVSAG